MSAILPTYVWNLKILATKFNQKFTNEGHSGLLATTSFDTSMLTVTLWSTQYQSPYLASFLRYSQISVYKSSAVAERGDRGHNRHVPKSTKSPGPRPTTIPSGILVHTDVWSQQTLAKNWGLCPFHRKGELGPCLTQCGLTEGLLPYQVASSSIQPFGHNGHGPKIGWGLCPFFWGEQGPHRTQSRLGRGLLPYQVAS